MTTTNDEYVEQFLLQQNSDKTRNTYAEGLRLFRRLTKDKPFSDVDHADVIAFKDGLTGAANTQQTRWRAPRALYTWLVNIRALQYNPFDGIKQPKGKAWEPRAATEEQVQAMLDALREPSGRNTRDRAIIGLLANGLRAGEVANLNLRDLQQENAQAQAYVKVTGKGGKDRVVPLNPSVKDLLHKWLYLRDKSIGSAMFVEVWGPDGEYMGDRVTVRQVQAAVERARERAGVTGVSAHSLRHYYATRLVKQGVTPFAVQRALGHESILTTQVYVSMDTDNLTEELRKDVTCLT